MKKVNFLLDRHYSLPITSPVPASSLLPKWHREGEMYINKNTGLLHIADELERAAGMRLCMPFFDSLSSGFFLTTWADIEITRNDGLAIEWQYIEKNVKGVWIKAKDDWDIVKERQGDIGYTIPRPAGHATNHMVWNSRWGWRLPKGWSMLVTHPLNQHQLPFTTLAAIVDSDRFASHGNIPFFLREGWTGIIEKGTPFAQLIPIKRSDWFIDTKIQDKEALFTARSAREVSYGYYRSKLWAPKKYKKEDKNGSI